jgi:parallel beta-helix repeat protein
MTCYCVVLTALVCLLLAAEASAGAKAEFFVAANGSDAWSGTLAAPNRAKTDGPFATLERARDAVRELKDPKAPATVYVRKGTYFLNDTFVLGPQDTHPVTFDAWKGEKVVISGGRQITGFKPVEVNGKKMLAAQIPEVKDGKWYFTQLFVNDHRRSRTRLPKKDYYRVADLPGLPEGAAWNTGVKEFKFNPGEIDSKWRNLTDVDVISLSLWIESREQIKSVDDATHIAHLNKPSVFWLWDDHNAKRGARYWIENVFEALDTPGQWYLDRPTGTLYYYPYAGEDASKLTVIAPKLQQLVRVGDGLKDDQYLSGIHFKNLRFAHTEPVHPADRGGYSQAAWGVPGAIYFQRALDCSIGNCEISHIGTYGVEVGPGCQLSAWGQPIADKNAKPAKGPGCAGVTIERNRILDMGAGGVKVQPGSEGTVIADNEIGDGGKIFMSAVGVWIGNSGDNTVTHNHIHDLYYTGVSMGWTWGYGETKTKNNIVEFNHIHHVGRGVLSDLGGIYTLGTQPNSFLRNNLIHDSYCNTYGGWGIYTDEGSSQIVIENNVVYNTQTGGFHQHYGKENTIRNNIFAFAKDQQLQRTRMEEHISFFFDHNIVYYDQGELLGSNWKDDDKFKMDYNDYWNASGKPVTFAGATFDDWKKRGHDEHSLITDPLFVDAKKHDFRLKPESPALKLGFKPIDTSTVGPRGPVGPARGQ